MTSMYRPTAKIIRKLHSAQALLAVLLIALMGLAGTARPALAVVPDENSQIAFTRNMVGYVMNADGTNQTRWLTEGGLMDKAAWSPDGSKLAFSSSRESNTHIYVVNADGTNVTRLTNAPHNDYWADWSPDGTRIAFSRYVNGYTDIFVINPDGSGETNLTNTPENHDQFPAWSPDSTRIAYTFYDGGSQLYVMDADGTNQTKLTNKPGYNVYPDWSPDGTRIAFTNCPWNNTEAIYVMNADGSGQTNLTDGTGRDTQPAWSPDGTRLAFVRYNDDIYTGGSNIYVMNADGTEQTRLTDLTGSYEIFPQWAPVVASNDAPSIDSFTAPADPVAVSTPINVGATFTDPDAGDTHTATIEWGDGSTSAGTVSSGSVSASHTYPAAGVYTLKLTVSDGDGASDSEIFQYVVVYDAEAGFVTGGGWINSPAGAYAADSSLSGKANFGFVSRYKKGATVPSGSTEFNFRVANMNFNSDTYEWLVVSGPKAQYKGSGTINGSGDYGFMLTANDGQVSGGGEVDSFRIKIWDKATGYVVYDNQPGDADDAAASTAITEGSIVIHTN